VLALDAMVDHDLFICPRGGSPVRPEDGRWHRAVPLARMVSLCFIWLSHLDRFLDPKHSMDAASSVLFLGRKIDRPISGDDLIGYYQGSM
jgi:hypothetical protein